MASQTEIGLRGAVARSRALIFPVLIVASVLVLVAPLPPVRDGHAALVQHHAVRRDPADDHLRRPPARFQRLPLDFARHDARAACAQRRLDAADPHPRRRGRHGSRRPRDSGLRRIRRRRAAVHWLYDLRDPDRDSIPGHHQGCHADQRSGRPLCLGRYAGQANGDRRRPQRRPDHAGSRPQAPVRSDRAGRLLWRHGRCQQIRPRRRHCRHCDHPGQHSGRLRHRRLQARHGRWATRWRSTRP